MSKLMSHLGVNGKEWLKNQNTDYIRTSLIYEVQAENVLFRKNKIYTKSTHVHGLQKYRLYER